MLSDAVRISYLDVLGIDLFELRSARMPQLASQDDVPAGVGTSAVAEVPVEGGVNRGVLSARGSLEPPEWADLREAVARCTRCGLHARRTQTVFGVGNRSAEWMIVGEAPGAEEDRRGEPFVGRAGKLLDEMLRAVGLDRDSAFIANILKCRPPDNRDPAAAEAEACRGHLDRQIELIQPGIILAVGRIAAQQLLGSDASVGKMRGRVHNFSGRNIPLVVTYHPAYLLRQPVQKREAWKDLCLARRAIGVRAA